MTDVQPHLTARDLRTIASRAVKAHGLEVTAETVADCLAAMLAHVLPAVCWAYLREGGMPVSIEPKHSAPERAPAVDDPHGMHR